jgi:hypothetical protein
MLDHVADELRLIHQLGDLAAVEIAAERVKAARVRDARRVIVESRTGSRAR